VENLTDFTSEQAVLGIIFCADDFETFARVSFLKSEEFYAPAHRVIFERMRKLHNESKPINMISVESSFNPDELDNTGGLAYFAELAKNAPSGKSLVYYADRVRDMASRRSALIAMENAKEALFDRQNETVSVINSLEGELDKLIISSAESDVLNVSDLIDMSVSEMEQSLSNERTGLSSGIPEIDDRLGYKKLAFGEITALGALSKNGKTLVANTIVARAGYLENESAHVFSIEMPSVGMFNGIVSAMSGVPNNFYARQDHFIKYLGEHQFSMMMGRWGAAAQELKEKNRVTIDGTKAVDADYICTNMRKQHAIHRNNGKRLRLVVIDHAHRMDYKTNGQPLTYAIRDAVRKIKNTAAELDIAVLLLCQLKNEAEDKDPTSFHILDSSSVRHELQAFIGTRIFKDERGVHFGIYGDSQRYGDMDTAIKPAYMRLIQGVLRSLPEGEYFNPSQNNEGGY
jgi:replicative DNA helicase